MKCVKTFFFVSEQYVDTGYQNWSKEDDRDL